MDSVDSASAGRGTAARRPETVRRGGWTAVWSWALLLFVAVPAGGKEAAGDGTLAAALERSLSARALKGAELAVLVVDDADGRVVFERHPDRALVPASNFKILTALAALRVFGPTHRFVTEAISEGPPDASGTLRNLYVRGGGDPGLTSEDYWRLAADLRRAGVRRVSGDLVIDDTLFDAERWHPSWLPVSARAYHAPVGALMANYGAFAVQVGAGDAEGDPVRITVDPPVPFLRISNQAKTRGSRSKLVVDRRARKGGEEVVVGGRWPRGREKTFHRSVLDPGSYAASVLRLQLEAVGIEVAGTTRRAVVPENAETIVEFEGRPVSDVVRRFLKYSNNPMGEALVKSMAVADSGAPGTWSAGTAVLRSELAAMGLPLDGLVITDGSGLSYQNRASPRLFVEALRRGRRSFLYGAEFVSGLPIGGNDGTLAKRAEEADHWVRAKTGLLTRVTGLSGLARRADGRTLVFSILVNGFQTGAQDAMDAVDGFAAALVGPRPGQEELSSLP
ncbi:MAG: D-alanyl-D-alanine carboxypeptidase/D-alanyl-D-alanine-endopeptidase [Myxococcota bacterium]